LSDVLTRQAFLPCGQKDLIGSGTQPVKIIVV